MSGNRKPPFRRGQWRVQRERFHIDSPSPQKPFQDSRGIEDLVPGVMKKLGLTEQHWQQELESQWKQIVGEDVAAHSRPGKYARGTLYVFVDSSVWLNELKRYAGKRIAEAIQERFGRDLVRQVRFSPDPDRGHTRRR